MSEMVERVARAISDAEGVPFSVTPTNPRHIALMRQARAAIEAMREPTREMLWHGDEYTDFYGPRPEMMAAVWQAMIDAALTSSEPAKP